MLLKDYVVLEAWVYYGVCRLEIRGQAAIGERNIAHRNHNSNTMKQEELSKGGSGMLNNHPARQLIGRRDNHQCLSLTVYTGMIDDRLPCSSISNYH